VWCLRDEPFDHPCVFHESKGCVCGIRLDARESLPPEHISCPVTLSQGWAGDKISIEGGLVPLGIAPLGTSVIRQTRLSTEMCGELLNRGTKSMWW